MSRESLQQAGLVFIGGGLGSLIRFVLVPLVGSLADKGFPFGTLSVNALGSFLGGLCLALTGKFFLANPSMTLFLTTGFLGGFTTYSAFNTETLTLLQDGKPQLAILNLAGTVLLCGLFGGLGLVLGFRLAKLAP